MRKNVTPLRLFNPAEFGKRIRIRIAERGIDLLVASQEIGCGHSVLSRIVNSKNAPRVENYLRIERWLAKGTGKNAPRQPNRSERE